MNGVIYSTYRIGMQFHLLSIIFEWELASVSFELHADDILIQSFKDSFAYWRLCDKASGFLKIKQANFHTINY